MTIGPPDLPALNKAFYEAQHELETCERGLEHSRKIAWQAGIDHYTERLPNARQAYQEAANEKHVAWDAFWAGVDAAKETPS